ncbi:RNA-guided endonuclease TnpB family protein [Thermus sp.]|uniref:RNA-guided endonuclease InsQ/TnpB family protein n=1 Tax=Thermus sp. TaxID=275 RepID=UPI00332AF76B
MLREANTELLREANTELLREANTERRLSVKIHRAYRYELDPNGEQRTLLAKHAGAARFAYNWGLARWKEIYETTGKSTNAIELHRELNRLKKTDFPWMYEVSKWAPQEALRDLEKAFKNFFQARKEGRKVGYPKPRRKKDGQDRFRLDNSPGTIRLLLDGEDPRHPGKARHIVLPRIGAVRLKEKPIRKKRDGSTRAYLPQGRILHATVTREADRWFVSLTVEEEIPDPVPPKGPAAGADAGLLWFLVIAEVGGGIAKIEAPKPLKKYLKRLQRLMRKLSRRGERDPNGRLLERTKNYEKLRLKIARLHRKIRNIRMDFLHKLTTDLVRTYPVIAIEDLNVAGMLKNDRLARHIADVGWGTFRALLEAKAKLRGVRLVKVNRFEPSSKMCHACGHVLKVRPSGVTTELPLSVRDWTCPNCGAHHDRDENAAKNLLRSALAVGLNGPTASSAGSHACGDGLCGGTARPVYEHPVDEAGSNRMNVPLGYLSMGCGTGPWPKTR